MRGKGYTKIVEPCIYTITCLTTGDFYVGSCWKPYQRFLDHMSRFRRNVHGNRYLQNIYNKYGAENFEYTTIRIFNKNQISRKGLYICEQMYIDVLKPKYNIAKKVMMPPEITEERRVKIGDQHSKEWVATDPSGKEYRFYNLRKFCRENNLCRPNMWYVAQGKMSNYKGWKCRRGDALQPEFISKSERCYKITNPEGDVKIIRNLSKYCRDNKLSLSMMNAIMTGARKRYKGYKIEKHSE